MTFAALTIIFLPHLVAITTFLPLERLRIKAERRTPDYQPATESPFPGRIGGS